MTILNGSRLSGFTLVELVIVIVLLGILSAIVAPKFFNLNDYRNRAAYDELADALRYAQKLAVASGCAVQVSTGANSYTLKQPTPNCTSSTFAPISNHPVTSGSFSGVTVSASPASFNFDPMGRCSSPVAINVGGLPISVVAETGYVDAP
ncbi:pilus assembly FimT family protein [Geopsychrobacter electrodiphilus]|uniref:pilus assembly FimT family protein n=1 Tax=Geopsychrobacter electrodiphilus TaxID=225196 RepID=UPI0003A7512D|nr:GspH/FimT family pseudopilin [Geopsychrobacter electrodiphilus]